ncbi:ependymin-related protein 1-like [Liolophura sinensis]|uniref:ependymin-related protein 1-like n=1 Tax=Liolophura sinensis TaxID=3198878 RepID=UPI003158DE21
MAVSTHYDGESTDSKFIIDFWNKREYNIDGLNCTESSVFLEMVPRCVPDNAQYLGSSYMGGGNNQIAFDSWNFFMAGWNTNITIALSQGDCTPLAEAVITLTKDAKSSMMAVFTSFTPGIKDPSVFVPPPGCQSNHKQKSLRNVSVNIQENNMA